MEWPEKELRRLDIDSESILSQVSGLSALEYLPDNASIQSLDMHILYVNEATRRMFGDNIIGKYCYEVYDRQSVPCEDCPILESYRTGLPATAQRIGVDANDEPWFADLMSAPLKDEAGKIIAGIEIVRNITDKKRAELALEGSNEERRHAKYLSDALGQISLIINSTLDFDQVLPRSWLRRRRSWIWKVPWLPRETNQIGSCARSVITHKC